MQNLKLQKIQEYVKLETNRNNYPSWKFLKKKFDIESHENINLKEIYFPLKIKFLGIPLHKSKFFREIIRKELINYIIKEVENENYPSRRQIESKFRLRLTPVLFKSINDLYSSAGLNYKKFNNQALKEEKANILTKLVVSIMPKLDLKVLKIRGVNQQGVDLLTQDKHNNVVGIEIKAYNQYEAIKKRNYLQLKNFVIKENLNKIILITSASKFENDPYKLKNLEIINYEKLSNLLNDNQLKELDYLRTFSIHQDTKHKNIKKQKIIEYAKTLDLKGEEITSKKMDKEFKLDFYTYFKSVNELYNDAGLTTPIKKAGGMKAPENKKFYEQEIEKILKYMSEEISKGHYPNGIEISKKFKLKPIWKFISMTELYNKLGVKPYLERDKRSRKMRL